MLKIDPSSRRFVSISERTLQPSPFCSRYSLADFIANSSEAFFEEAGRPWMLLGRDWETSPGGRRAELLAVDREGRLHVIATQHGDETPDLIEPLETASRLAIWTPRQIGRRLDAPTLTRLREFLEVPTDRLNIEQGAVVVAESFDLDTLATAGWLRERYGVSVACIRLRAADDSLTGLGYCVVQDMGKTLAMAYRERRSEVVDAPWPGVYPDENGWQPASLPEGLAVQDSGAAPAPVAAPPTEREPEPTPEPVAAPAPDDGLQNLEELADDPLAELVRAHETAEAKSADPGDGSNRRRSERHADFHARRLRLDYLGRLLGARLVDFSEHGIGVEALSPLPVGSEVGISGELIGRDRSLGIEGRVKVEHCRANPDGVCRIGFSIENAMVRPIDADEQAFDRR